MEESGAGARKQQQWRIWADTGGTFTDCLGIAPDDESGALHRAKVLSAGVLRAALLHSRGDGGRVLSVQEQWAGGSGGGSSTPLPRDFVSGLSLRPAGAAATDIPAVTIIHYEAHDAPHGGNSRIEIDRPLPADCLIPGTLLEVIWPAEAPLIGAHLLTRTPYGVPLPPMAMRVATTRGTNALLTRRGTPPALFVTRGFADLLEIGTQQRPDLFALDILKPEPLYGAVVEVEERLTADGAVLRALDESALREAARALRTRGFTTAAVALLHADRNNAHEARVADLLREAGFTHVSCSADLAPFIKVLPRAQTAVVNAYLAPVIDAYVGGLTAATLHLMTSAGGLVGTGAFRPKDSLLSGPAGGVVGAARAAHLSGHPRLIAFDMGGTSTDVARCDVEQGYDYVFEHRVGDAHLVAPALAIESVAAGGGSICVVERKGLRVGPESAGAYPGPACYGAGGPLTVTDVNLLLGRLDPARFEIPIDQSAAEAAADALLSALERETGERMTREALLSGFLDIANERMADAIRTVSVRRGYDPAEHALVAFGGAGGQHACAVAERLSIPTVLVPQDAGLLSALGIGHASIERFAEQQMLARVTEETEATFERTVAQLAEKAIAAVAAEGVPQGATVGVRRRIAALRLAGQESALEVEYVPGGPPLAELFAARFAAVFGYRPDPARPVEVVSLRVVAGSEEGDGARQRGPYPPGRPEDRGEGQPESGRHPAFFEGAWSDAPVIARESLRPDSSPIVGPALIVERHSATVVEPGWSATVDASGALVLRQEALPPPLGREGEGGSSVSLSPIDVELFTARFTALAEEMGEMLRRTALSVNVKERLDFSCALLGPAGDLVASAAHIPVHLGALGLCVRTLREQTPMAPGDVLVTNHPAYGGSHLPDVTVVTPVHDEASGTLLGYVASRAHHAEIGGSRPGSMPPDATRLLEEGVVIPPTPLFRAGVADRDAVIRLLTDGPYPTRSLADNLADLEAAVAANRRGADALRALAAAHGVVRLHTAMEALAVRADALLGEALAPRAPGRYEAVDALDDGSPLRVAITLEGSGDATVDFTGTGATHPGNLNATPAIVRSAALYVLRLLVNQPLPLNEGLLRRVRLVLPSGSLLSPDFDREDPANCPAVVGGNTETSQRVVDLLLEAVGLAANSQGTMNNVLFGNETFGYYETVCGGAGATPTAPGASSVHTHMTNTRITDPEVLERRCPVRVERFAVRRGSGGAGRHPGGDGVVREIAFLAPMSLSVLTQHRTSGPHGLEGGGDGAPGQQTVIRADGSVTPLGSVDGCEVLPGDRLLLETPGGGGWGNPTD